MKTMRNEIEKFKSVINEYIQYRYYIWNVIGFSLGNRSLIVLDVEIENDYVIVTFDSLKPSRQEEYISIPLEYVFDFDKAVKYIKENYNV